MAQRDTSRTLFGLYLLFTLLHVVISVDLDSMQLLDGDLMKPGKEPQHIHLSLSSDASQMHVTWYTIEDSESYVQYGQQSHPTGTDIAYAHENVNPIGTSKLTYGSGYIHTATMSGLKPSTKYYYRVGEKGHWSSEFYFTTRERDANRYVSVFVHVSVLFPACFVTHKYLTHKHINT